MMEDCKFTRSAYKTGFSNLLPGNHDKFNRQIVKFRIDANVTQRMYGMRRSPASMLCLKKSTIVSTMKIQSMTISIKAAPGFFRPKKK